MGSGTSRGKKVAPACVSEVNVAKTASSKRDNRAFKPRKIRAILRTVRNRAPPDSHSEGHDSDFSREDEDMDGELDTVLADYEEGERAAVRRSRPKKAVIRSRTYGLCHVSQEEEEEEQGAQEPCGSTGVKQRSKDAFTHFKKHTPASSSQHTSSSQGFLTRGSLLEAVPTSQKQSTFGSCHSSSLTMPVILYDGSEEELMDTIERDFS